MKHSINLYFILALILLSSCKYAEYLPTSQNIGENQFGSYINIKTIDNASIKGELIAVTSDMLYVLTKNDSIVFLDSANTNEVKDYFIRYAKGNGRKYGWMIPVTSLLTLSHGVFMIISLPVNLLTTSIVTFNAANSFTVKKKNITWGELKMFARFPQGIPQEINKYDLKLATLE